MALAPLKLPRLATNFRIVDDKGLATVEFQLFWQEAMEAVEEAFNGIAGALVAAGIALDAADVALAAADAAQTAADETTASSSLASSYVTGLTVSAVDAGSDATIDISAHTRVYATNPPTSVSVNAGSVTGLAYSTVYYIYYDQASRAGGAVTYQVSTDVNDVAQINDRHSVATATTPAAAAPPNDGSPVLPPGGSYL